MGIFNVFKINSGEYSYIQKKVREVTADSMEDPRLHEMRELANISFDESEVEPMMEMIYQRLNDKGCYRHVSKSLILLHYLVCFGSIDVVNFVSDNMLLLNSLSDYYFVERGREVCSRIRSNAKIIVALLNDKYRLEKVRHKAAIILHEQDAKNQLKADAPPDYSQIGDSDLVMS